jgi:hypothetical protein
MSLFDAIGGSPGVFTESPSGYLAREALVHIVICSHSEPCLSGFNHFITARQPIVLRVTTPQLNPMETCVGHQHFIRPECRPVGYTVFVCLKPGPVLLDIAQLCSVLGCRTQWWCHIGMAWWIAHCVNWPYISNVDDYRFINTYMYYMPPPRISGRFCGTQIIYISHSIFSSPTKQALK